MIPLEIDRENPRGPFPDDIRGLTDAELDRAIDAYYANQFDEDAA